MMASRLRLVIKAANGSLDDFRVEAEAEWSVHQLKTHLYRHYPTHPPLSSQRLIHSGQLLLDQQLIRQLPNFQEEALVIHLVAFERSVSAPAFVSSRLPAAATTTSRQPSLSPVAEGVDTGDDQTSDDDGSEEEEDSATQEGTPTSTATEVPPPSQSSSSSSSTAPDAWLRYRGGHHYGDRNAPPPPPPPQMMMMGGGAYYAGFPPPPQFFVPPYGQAFPPNNPYLAQWYHNYYGRPAAETSGEGDDLYDPQLLEDPDQIRNQDNNEDVAMNAGALGLMGGANFQHRRDMVDYLYMLMMAGFLALIAFITGSFGRLLIFFAGVIFMLLNQAGWFSLQRRAVAVAPEANEVVPPPDAQIRPEQQQGLQQEPPTNETTDDSPQQDIPEPDPPSAAPESDQPPVPVPDQPLRNEPDRPGLATTIVVFVTSFFTSLLPQQRAEFQAN